MTLRFHSPENRMRSPAYLFLPPLNRRFIRARIYIGKISNTSTVYPQPLRARPNKEERLTGCAGKRMRTKREQIYVRSSVSDALSYLPAAWMSRFISEG